MWLFPLQGRGLAIQVPHDTGDSNILYCYCAYISVKLIRLYCNETVSFFPSWNYNEGLFLVKYVVYDLKFDIRVSMHP